MASLLKKPERHALGILKDILAAAGLPVDTQRSGTDWARLVLAYELGKFRDLRAGDLLTDCARAGVKMLEGGPFSGKVLPLSRLKENMLVPDRIDAVMEHVGAELREQDWSKMWPYGVISCSYELEEGR